MRLQSIKLAGFKSFADPTTFELPGQLVGVVGPNGCGKSNIMDAVRWVLGESKASELRGESMQDVIFNGTNQRRPASRASVELVFDNASQRAGGQWGQFAEVSVRRVLTRDGNSSYYINQQQVRRRDVQDVFLGTGLGPRAYAIIGQGTISRIIESRPEELRLFLEEAAGVSRYKERRRETATRLASTRDNLLRVEDILRELDTQLERLDQQAAVARQYHQLHERMQLSQWQLWFLRWREAQVELERAQTEGRSSVNRLEEVTAALRHVEAELEALRQAHFMAGERVQAAQTQRYAAGAEVARLQAEQRHQQDNLQRLQRQQQEAQAQSAHWQAQLTAHLDEKASLEGGIDTALEQAEIMEARSEEQAAQITEWEEAAEQALAALESQRQRVTQRLQALQQLAADQRVLESSRRQWSQRRDQLAQESATLVMPDLGHLEHLSSRLHQVTSRVADTEAQLLALQEQQPMAEARRREQRQLADQEQQRLTHVSARLQALQALQEQLSSNDRLQPWLQRHELTGLSVLWQRMETEPGWAVALEAALRERMSALETLSLERLAALAHDPPPSRLAFFQLPVPSAAVTGSGVTRPGWVPLSACLHLHDPAWRQLMQDWLKGCWCAADLDEALQRRHALQMGETLWTPQGHLVAAHHVSFHAEDDPHAGLLARAQEITNLEREERAIEVLQRTAHQAWQVSDTECTELQAQILASNRLLRDSQTEIAALQLDQSRLNQSAQQVRERHRQIADELADIDAQLEALEGQGMALEEQVEQLDQELASAQEQQFHSEERWRLARQRLALAQESRRVAERQAQEARFHCRSLSARQEELQRHHDTASQQVQQLGLLLQRLAQEQQGLTEPATQQQLDDALSHEQSAEARLSEERQQHDALGRELREHDSQRSRIEADLEPLRQLITRAQLQEQAAQLAIEQHAESLRQSQADVQQVERSLQGLSPRPSALQAEIERCQRELNALGPVNLAALEELTSARERKQFLDAQVEDLQTAISTLEGAIRQIDAETRELLGATFETVNQHFGRMFPELFGGGQARLVMTGDEILDAGVQVMAQPPGKRNQTIHLLSGGEKALTAIALVFAIFQLNPAPFCLLDEVDAPLDDSNTARYARLVSSMSHSTQFLFISHNKIAMEMARQLIGVTMQEQGVSRIVAVDMEGVSQWIESA